MTIHFHRGDLPDGLDLGKRVAIDTETQGLSLVRDGLCLVQLSAGDGEAHIVQPDRSTYDCPNLKALLADTSVEKLLHFARFDLAIIERDLGVTMTPVFCTKIASKLVRTYTDRHGLKDVCREIAGVELGRKGEVMVDAGSQSSVPSIYAVGDVTDRIALTPVAIAEGHAFADSIFGGRPRTVSHSNVPSAVFTQPPIGSVGPGEKEARAIHGDVTVYTSKFNAMKNNLSGRSEKTFMKLIVDTASDKVVAAHMVGPDAGEIIQGIGVAVIAGATKADFDATIGIHPTAAEEFVTMRTPRD